MENFIKKLGFLVTLRSYLYFYGYIKWEGFLLLIGYRKCNFL